MGQLSYHYWKTRFWQAASMPWSSQSQSSNFTFSLPHKNLRGYNPNLIGARYFSKLDARSGYWAIKLTEKSSHLTSFNTPFGRYRFLRMPFGIRSAQDECQRKIDEIYEGLQGVTTLIDDILVYGKTREEHDANLRNVVTLAKKGSS